MPLVENKQPNTPVAFGFTIDDWIRLCKKPTCTVRLRVRRPSRTIVRSTICYKKLADKVPNEKREETNRSSKIEAEGSKATSALHVYLHGWGCTLSGSSGDVDGRWHTIPCDMKLTNAWLSRNNIAPSPPPF